MIKQHRQVSRHARAPVIGIEISKNAHSVQDVGITGHFNNQPYHLAPLALSIIDNTS